MTAVSEWLRVGLSLYLAIVKSCTEIEYTVDKDVFQQLCPFSLEQIQYKHISRNGFQSYLLVKSQNLPPGFDLHLYQQLQKFWLP